MANWQPIETAPKDGTYVILRFDGPFRDTECPGVAVGRFCDSAFVGYWWLTCILASGGLQTTSQQPSFWMPLPDPPVRGSDEFRDYAIEGGVIRGVKI